MYYSQPLGGDWDALASHFKNSQVIIHFYIQTMIDANSIGMYQLIRLTVWLANQQAIVLNDNLFYM